MVLLAKYQVSAVFYHYVTMSPISHVNDINHPSKYDIMHNTLQCLLIAVVLTLFTTPYNVSDCR